MKRIQLTIGLHCLEQLKPILHEAGVGEIVTGSVTTLTYSISAPSGYTLVSGLNTRVEMTVAANSADGIAGKIQGYMHKAKEEYRLVVLDLTYYAS